MAHVIFPLGLPRRNASARDRMWSGLFSGASSSPIFRVGVTSIWFTRTTETWVRKRPRSRPAAGPAKLFARPASATAAEEQAALRRKDLRVQFDFMGICSPIVLREAACRSRRRQSQLL